MDLFSITCTTCKTRLKVREQAAIGQILACPKCGGMVMVKPPPNWSAGTAENAEQPTATEVIANVPQVNQTIHNSAFEALDDLLSDAPPKARAAPPQPSAPTAAELPPPAAPSTTAAAGTRRANTPPGATLPPSATPSGGKPRFVEGPRVISSSGRFKPVPAPTEAKPESTPAAASSPAAFKEAEALPPPPPAEHDPAPTPRVTGGGRFWLLVAGSVAAGIVLAFIAVTGAIRFLRGPSTSRALPSASRSEQPAATPQAQPDVPPPAGTELPPSEPASEAPPLTAKTPPADDVRPATGAPIEPAPDPAGIVTAPPNTDQKAPSTDSLAKFDRLIGGANDDPLANPTGTPPPRQAPPPTEDPTPARPIAPRPTPREVDVAKRLADPLPGIETAGTPLADFLQVVSDLSTIPITLELDALPFVNASAASPVVVNAANSTVGESLAAALRPLKLEALESDGQLTVRAVENPQTPPLNFPVKDLAADEEAITALAETLRALVEPASWGDAAGQGAGSMTIDAAKGVIVVRHSRAVHAQLLMLCEKLRTARGQKHLSRLDPAHFKLDTRAAKALARLETPIALNYSQPTRITAILDRLGELSGVRILVDWRDVATAGWNPAGEATLVVSQQPLSAALDALLAPLDLAWRIVDGQTLQVVTPARIAERLEIELYKVGELTSADPAGEALLAKIRAALEGDGGIAGDPAAGAGAGGEVRFDADGKCLLAALPQPKQRQLEALLAAWRKEASAK